MPETPPNRYSNIPVIQNKMSRLQMRLDSGDEIELPDLDPSYTHFVTTLFEAGPATYTRDSMAPLSWVELDAYQRCSGVSLAPWEARLIRSLSTDYVVENGAARAQDAPPPWDYDPSASRKVKVAKHIRNVLRGK